MNTAIFYVSYFYQKTGVKLTYIPSMELLHGMRVRSSVTYPPIDIGRIIEAEC